LVEVTEDMARIRTIKPEAMQHRKVGKLSDRAFRLWIGLLTQCDDDGRVVAEPEQLKVEVFGYQAGTSTERVADALKEISRTGLIRLYRKAHTRYAYFPSWREHQRIHKHHYTASRLPSPNGTGTVQVPYRGGTSTAGSDQDRIGSGSRVRLDTRGMPETGPADPDELIILAQRQAELRRLRGTP